LIKLSVSIRKWFQIQFLDINTDGVGYNFYHTFGEERSCVVMVADHSICLSVGEGFSYYMVGV